MNKPCGQNRQNKMHRSGSEITLKWSDSRNTSAELLISSLLSAVTKNPKIRHRAKFIVHFGETVRSVLDRLYFNVVWDYITIGRLFKNKKEAK